MPDLAEARNAESGVAIDAPPYLSALAFGALSKPLIP